MNAPVVNMQFETVIRTADGVIHASKQDAENHLRRPFVLTALLALAGGDKDLAAKLQDSEDDIRSALETGTIRRVAPSERNALKKSLEAVKAALASNPAFAFVADNADAIATSFRWPVVQRLTEEEKAAAALEQLTAVFDGQKDAANWVLQEKTKLLEAYNAGKPTRAVPQAAADGLAAYREMKAAEKAVKAAQEAFDAAATPENKTALDEANAAFAAAKKVLDDRKAATEAAKKEAQASA